MRLPLDAIRQIAACIFPPTQPLTIEQVPEGVSTFVYRIARDEECFYLRVLPEAGASFAPEVGVHELLRARGVSVPVVVHFEHRNAALQRSVMVTTAIPGHPLARSDLDRYTPAILHRAGQDLAIINSLPVSGFGWIERDHDDITRLTAPHLTFRSFRLEHHTADLALLAATLLDTAECMAIERILDRAEPWPTADQAYLAHGDLDTTHIYRHQGTYGGIIDFGELRGADPWYDLGHFHLHDGEHLPSRLLPQLLAGYRSVTPLPGDAELRIAFASLLIAIRALARVRARHATHPLISHCLPALRRDIAFLAAHLH